MLVETGDAQVHATADVKKVRFGKNLIVWRWSHLSDGVEIGDNVMIGDYVFIGSNVKIGNNVRIQNSSQIFEGVIIEDNVYIGPSVIFTNVRKPKIDRKGTILQTLIKKGVSIGANSTIVCGIEIGENTTILPGCVVHKSIPANVTCGGNPARILKQLRTTL